jgi:hypothetical protein
MLGRGSGPTKGMTRTRGVLLSAGERGRGDTLSGLTPGGPWAKLAAGPFWFPEAFFIFLFLFHFPFLFSLLFSILLQKCIKSIQNSF